jgi:pimeloyl-ACP methyl ester carboxylesterase
VESITAGGHRLEVVRLEPAEGEKPPRGTLVFLHEGLGSVALWKHFPKRVADATGCAAVVYSRYGYGGSEPLHEARGVDYMHREALEVLPQLLIKLDVRAPILIGHSDGASIALIYAGARAGPLLGAVLMAPHVFVEEISVRSIAQAKSAFETTDLPARLARYHENPAATFYGWNDIWLAPAFAAWNIEGCLEGISVPLLVLQGIDDQYGTRAQVDAIAQRVLGPVQLVMLERCAHSPHIDREETTLAEIAGFVESLAHEPR